MRKEYIKKRGAKGMKSLRKITALAAAGLMLLTGTACQQTPQKSAVVHKDNYEENVKKETE